MNHNKLIKQILVITTLVAITFYLGKCSGEKSIISNVGEVINYKHSQKEYRAKDGTVVHKNEVLQTNLETLKILNDSLVDYIDNIKIKKPKVVTIIDTRYVIDSTFIPVEIPCDTAFKEDFDSGQDSTFSIEGFVDNSGIHILSLSFPNRTTVTLGTKKNGIFKKNEFIVATTNSNPHIKVEGISSYVFKDDKKWFQKGWVKVAAGAIIATGIHRQFNK